MIPYYAGIWAEGVTIQMDVLRGEVWWYASKTDYNPDSQNYVWRFFTTEYNEFYIDSASLEGMAGRHLFFAIEGTNMSITNTFILNVTRGDTTTTYKSACM